MAAHSFGGFVIGNYALKYTRHIKRLLLISPIGIRPVEPGEPPLHPYKRFEGRKNGPLKGSAFLGRWLWDKKMSPLEPGRKVHRKISLNQIKKYVVNR